ncbi:MAG: sulfite exporter TauE/SafE family protein [Flavobacteriales bacterium]|nr:sulfite exporter TauE/SafE family protein [Flavobacteriales bacterium]
MDPAFLALPIFFLIAALYSSVGHAGASGYLAVMALLGFAPETIKPTSLILNVVVAGIASWRYLRAGRFNWKVFWPVTAIALPLAFVGGRLELPVRVFAIVAGVFLLTSALLIAWRALRKPEKGGHRPMPFTASLAVGAPIGFVSGIIGVGGGIFLSPVLIQGRWAALRDVSGISALFILVNSLSGLAGRISTGLELHPFIPWWLLAVVLGGLLGSWLGVSRLGARAILAALFLVLMTAGVKLLIAG